jgi:hypothetical protein
MQWYPLSKGDDIADAAFVLVSKWPRHPLGQTTPSIARIKAAVLDMIEAR